MAQCSRCNAETELHDSGRPICVDCDVAFTSPTEEIRCTKLTQAVADCRVPGVGLDLPKQS